MPSEDLDAIVRTTVGHYAAGARSFWEGTRSHDVTQNYDALLRANWSAPGLARLFVVGNALQEYVDR